MFDALESIHPTVRRWFTTEVGEPTVPRRRGWGEIAAGRHTLIAAPTGSGKTLATFLWCIDGLLKQGDSLRHETRVLYVSPLKAFGNDVQKNSNAPLARWRELDLALPEVRVLVRSGDTLQRKRVAMARRPPHVLVTTPKSLYILLTSISGRALLSTVRTLIVDEIHALLGDKHGAHLALLRRYAVMFRAVASREKQPLPWRDISRALRLLELRGDVRGGRFVTGFSGEQFALPEAIPLLRKLRRDAGASDAVFTRHDPLQCVRSAIDELIGSTTDTALAD